MTQQIIFQIILLWVSKNAEFVADFETVEKVVKNTFEKSCLHEIVGIIYFFAFQFCV